MGIDPFRVASNKFQHSLHSIPWPLVEGFLLLTPGIAHMQCSWFLVLGTIIDSSLTNHATISDSSAITTTSHLEDVQAKELQPDTFRLQPSDQN